MFLPSGRKGAKNFIVEVDLIACLMIVIKLMKGCRIEVEMTNNPVGGCKPRQRLEELKRKAGTPVDVPALTDSPKFLFTIDYSLLTLRPLPSTSSLL